MVVGNGLIANSFSKFKSICKNFNNYNSPEYNNKIIKKYLKV